MTDTGSSAPTSRKPDKEHKKTKKKKRHRSEGDLLPRPTQRVTSPPLSQPEATLASPSAPINDAATLAQPMAQAGNTSKAEVLAGVRVQDTACCAQLLASDDEVVLLRVPADIDPVALRGSCVALPCTSSQAAALNDADGFELVHDVLGSHRQTYVLGVRGGEVTAAPVAQCYSIRWQLQAPSASEDMVDTAWLDSAADAEAQQEVEGPQWTKHGSGNTVAQSSQKRTDDGTVGVQGKKKRKSTKRQMADTEEVAAAVAADTEAAMAHAMRTKKQKRASRKSKKASQQGDQE